jgi:hypothetical protein
VLLLQVGELLNTIKIMVINGLVFINLTIPNTEY